MKITQYFIKQKRKIEFKEIAIIMYTKTHQLYVRLAWEQKWTSQPTIRPQ